MKDKSDHPKSKALLFLEALENKNKFSSLKEADMVVLASTLNGLGNVLLSCSSKEDKISNAFLVAFIKFAESETKSIDTFEQINDNFSHLERSILYFWATASYFKYSSNTKEAFNCYKKVILLLVGYVRVSVKSGDKSFTQDRLKKLKKIVFNRAIQNLYSHYENTNMVEIQKIKWLFTKQMYENIPLNILSIFPDLEELVLSFHELELLCGKTGNIASIYNSTFMTKNRIQNTFYERIASLRLKGIINMKILNQLLHYESFIDKSGCVLYFYKYFKKYLNNKKNVLAPLGAYAPCFKIINAYQAKDRVKNRIDLLEFLISDTMFSLSKIIEIISPSTRTTLFSESYMAEIYRLLFHCNQLYELIYMTYKWIENKESAIVEKLYHFARYDEKKDDSQKEIKKQIIKHLLKNIEERLEGPLKEKLKKEKIKTSYLGYFFNQIFKDIDKANIHININNYLAEMALKKYRRAREIHREGVAYKEMISNFHFLEDDLNNDTCQFHMGIERYLNNCGFIDDRIKELKRICRNSSILDVNKYINTDAKTN